MDAANNPCAAADNEAPVALELGTDVVLTTRKDDDFAIRSAGRSISTKPGDLDLAARLRPAVERPAGCIIGHCFPTNVEVTHAMVYGGPWPATSDARTTSVGSRANDRFPRPVSYQNFPKELLGPALQDHNPMGVWPEVDGELDQH